MIKKALGAGAIALGIAALFSLFAQDAETPAPAPKPKTPATEPVIVDARQLTSQFYVITRQGAGLFEQDRVNDKVGDRFASFAKGSCIEPYTVTLNEDVHWGHALVTAEVGGMRGIQTGYVDMTAITPAPSSMTTAACRAEFTEYRP